MSKVYVKSEGKLMERHEYAAQHTREANPFFGAAFSSVGNVSSSMFVHGLERPAENLLWIYLGMMARAEAVSQVALRVSNAAGDIIESGPLVQLLERPNTWMDTVQYLSTIESYLALYNECMIVIIRGASKEPIELIPLNPKHCEPVTAVHAEAGVRVPVGWRYTNPTTGEMQAFEPDDIIPIVIYSPYDTTRALWPSKPGKRAMQIDVLSQEQNLAIFKNGGMPDVVFETEQSLTEDQAKEFLDRWQDRYGGAANAHKPGLLYNGLKSKPIGLSPTDLQFFEGRRMSRQEQIALMRVKPVMVGLMEGETGLSQGSSGREQKGAWWAETGLFELARISAAHNRALADSSPIASVTGGRELDRYEREAFRQHVGRMRQFGVRSADLQGFVIWFDEHDIEELMEIRLQKIDILQKLLAEGWPPDEAAEYLSLRLPPHPTNTPTIAFNRQPISDLTPTAPPATKREMQARPSRLDKLFDQLRATIVEVGDREAPDETTIEREVSAQDRRLRRVFDEFIFRRERAAARKWSRFFLEQRQRVLDRYDEAIAQASQREDPQLDDFDLAYADILDAIFPRAAEDELLIARLSGLWMQHLEDGFTFFGENENPTEKPVDFSVDDPGVRAAIEARRIQGTKVNETTEGQLRDVLRAGFEEGDTTVQLADRIDAYYKDNIGETAARPMTAARTQTAGIVNDGRLMAAKEAGGLLKGWLHGDPEEARDHHIEAERRYQENPIPLDKDFVLSNGVAMPSPGAAEAPIGEIANCTCMLTFHPAGGEQ